MTGERPAPLSPAELGLVRLSGQERAVLCLVAEGFTDAEIGAVLVLSQAAVYRALSAIRERLGARNRAQMAAIGVRLHLTGEPPLNDHLAALVGVNAAGRFLRALDGDL